MANVDERRKRLQDALTEAADSLHALDKETREASSGEVALLEKVLAYAQVVVEETDPDLIPEGTLTTIQNEAGGIASDAAGAVSNARVYADDLLAPLATLPVARGRDMEQAVKDAAANFQRSASARLNSLGSDVDEKTTEIEEEVSNLRATVTEATDAMRTEIESTSTAFESKLAEFETTLTSQRQAISEALERQSQGFSESQEERSDSFQAEIASAKEELGAMLGAAREEVDARVAEIRRMEEESSGLVHSIGLGGTAERYGDEAKEQKKVADWYRVVTIALALGAVAMAIFAVVHQADETSAVLAKLGVSAVFGALATYTARQSGRHRKREERAAALQLELTAFAPFIEPLDDNLKHLERVLMTRKTFGNIAPLPEAPG